MARRRIRKRLTAREYLEGKVRRARKRSTKDYWLNRLVSWGMKRGRSQSAGARRRWSFNRKRY